MKLRGFLTVATAVVFFLLGDLVQRLVIAPLVWMAPTWKERVLAGWQRWLASTLISLTRVVGGGKFEPIPTIPSTPGVLVLMNHQSLLDIPIVVRSLAHGYPRIVTRKRYARGVPLLSKMIELYEYPVVDPRGPMKRQLKMLQSVARDPRVPIVVYPEGTRSRDGELLPFRRGAVDTLLRHRQWEVYLLTSDGTLPCGRLKDMLGGVDEVHCRVTVSGPFATPSDPREVASWLEEMEGRMRHGLVELRQAAAFSSRGTETSQAEAVGLTERGTGSGTRVRRARARGMTHAGGEPARLLTHSLVAGTGTQLRAVLLYGSHLLGAAPDRYSAHDLVVVVEDYLRTYQELRRRGFTHRPPRLMASLAWLLPPNVIAFSPEDAGGPIAKCLIISARDFEQELSARSRDHFMISRMIQEVGVLYVRDAAAETWLDERLEAARKTVLDWAAPYVATPFTAESLTREMIAICYRSEIRPESGSRAGSVFEAQRADLVETYEKLLADAIGEGHVVREGRGYRSVRRPGPMTRLRRSAYFNFSKVRVTARWIKHVLTFENWLPYVVRKVERRTGMSVELTAIETRLPLIFLWPRLLRVLRNRPTEEATAGRVVAPESEGDP